MGKTRRSKYGLRWINVPRQYSRILAKMGNWIEGYLRPRRTRIMQSPTLVWVLLFWAGSTIAAERHGFVARGGDIAKTKCAPCHAIGRHGTSKNARAPPFRTLAAKFPLENLEEALAEGISVGHQGPEMPEFRFSPAEIEDLLSYIRSVARR
jgi:cytochrome c